MKYHPHIFNRYNPRQPYYGMSNYNGALSWYSKDYVEMLLYSPYWQTKQSTWAKGDATYFNKTNVSNELKGWNYWKSRTDFSEIVLYIVMSMIFEKKQPLTFVEHGTMMMSYKTIKGDFDDDTMTADNKILWIENLLEKLREWGYPETLSDLTYAYNRMLTYFNRSVTDAVIDTFSTDTNLPASPLSDEERETIQTYIEFQRRDKQRKKDKSKKKKKKLSKKQKITIGVTTGTLSVGLLVLLVLLNRRK